MPTQRILIVDDERLTRISLADFLEEEGYRVMTADNGNVAIQLQQEQPFGVCIVDIRIPGIDGVETILALHRIAPDSRFIIFTGSPQFAVPPALEAIGISEHDIIHKPVLDMKVFVSRIEQTTRNQKQEN